MEVFHSTPRVLATLIEKHYGTSDAAGNHTPRRVALTTWETSHFPDANAEMLARYDAVIVPSQFCAAVMGGSPFVVPHCFDEEWWPVPTAPSHPTLEQGVFRFYAIGAWSERKNMLGVLKAYLSAFTKADRVQLVMLIDDPDFNEIRKTLACSGIDPDDLPELHIPGEPFTEDQLLELHQGGHCIVSAHRGEGWGLGLFEAAIMGRRIITPAWSGETDFLVHTKGLYPVLHQMTPCFGLARMGAAQGGVAKAIVGLPQGVTCKQLWMEPDLAAMATLMRSLYTSPDMRTADQLRAGRQALEQRFGYKVVGPQLASVLKEIADGKRTEDRTR